MNEIFRALACYNVEKNIIENGDRLLLGISGGADSVFLFYFLLFLSDELDLKFECVHINYNLRGDDSVKDMEFCQNLCKEHNIKLTVFNVGIDGESNIQEKARKIRYEKFREVMKKSNLNKLAIAHNGDDKTETVLYHIIRGCGINGLKSMESKEQHIVRPLLTLKADFIRKNLKENEIEFVVDKTNAESKYIRNYLRNEIIPMLEKINPNIFGAITSLSTHAQNYYLCGNKLYNELFSKYVKEENEDFFVFKAGIFFKEGFVVKIFLEHFFKNKLGKKRGIYSSDIDEIIKMAGNNPGKVKKISDWLFINDYKTVIVISENKFDEMFPDFDECRFNINEKIPLIELEHGSPEYHKAEKNEILINKSKIKWPLRLRHRKNGDRIGRHRSLKKFLIDSKVNKMFRDRIPVLEDSDGNIIWIPGLYSLKFKQSDMKMKFTGRIFWIKE
ncbi:MAG: tRNA lysidine(34) synthetase TilS [Candidatus Muiribacteriota bacterium]